jgi:hypothetical protein
MKKLMRLLKEEEGVVKMKKGTSDSEIKKYTDKGINVQLVDQLEEEAGRKYTAEESAAVGKTVGKSLLKVLRGQGDEVVDIRLTGIGLNKFSIKVKYGNDKGQDLFKFTLNPETEDITLILGTGEEEQLVDFVITQGNQVSLPTPELEDKLSDAMVKSISEPSDEEYDEMAAMQAPTDPSQFARELNEGNFDSQYYKPYITRDPNNPNFIKVFVKYPEGEGTLTALGQRTMSGQERDFGAKKAMDIAQLVAYKLEDTYNLEDIDITDNENGKVVVFAVSDDFIKTAPSLAEKLSSKSKPETYIKDFQKSDAPQFKGKSDEKRRQMAIAAYMSNKNEALDAVGKEDDDINNDGKVDSTDKYLGKRRQAIAKNMKEDLDVGHQDNEPAMLKKDVYRIAKMASMLYKELDKYDGMGEVDFPHWWQAKIIKAYDYLQSAYGYLDAEQKTQEIDNAVVTTMALNEKKSTCCHKCGHSHVKGTAHPTPYRTGKNSCKYNTTSEETKPTAPGDVTALEKTQQSATSVLSKNKNINNIGEFPGAFEIWMKTLGLVPEKTSRGSIETQVRKILTNLGYK